MMGVTNVLRDCFAEAATGWRVMWDMTASSADASAATQ